MDPATVLALAGRDGDRRAIEAFVGLVQVDVWRYCSAMVGTGDADDVAQEALLRVVRALPSYRGDAPARAWALSITRRATMDWLRGSYRRRALMDRLRQRAGDGAQVDGGWAEVAEMVSHLDTDRRDAFVLTQVLGWSYAEAADACGCPVGTIRSRVARARVDLIGQLDEVSISEGREPS